MMNYNQPYYQHPQPQYDNRYNPYLNQPQGLRVMFVSNKEEANATPIDVSGNPNFFYNRGLNEIYVKQFDVKTGITNFEKFIKSDFETEETNKANLYDEQFKMINDRLDELHKLLNKKEVANAK